MKKILKNNNKTRRYLDSLPTMSLVFRAAGYGTMTFPFTGKYTKDNIPLVYDYYDGNGTCDLWLLKPIAYTTTFSILCWFKDRFTMERIAENFNRLEKLNREVND